VNARDSKRGRLILTIFALCACFFFLFSLGILALSLALEDPLLSIVVFLSSTLMISISGAILFGLLYRLVQTLKSRGGEEGEDEH